MKKLLFLMVLYGLFSQINAQNTGINTTSPKATLDINLPTGYTNGQLAGVTIPQLIGDQIEAMSASTPKVGTIVYATAVSTAATKDVTAVGYWYWKDAADKWEPFTLGTSAAGNTVDWSVNGNSGTTAANYLGTKDNQPLNFKTNGTTDTNPKMTILPNGNVGIATTTPQYKLDVNGIARLLNTNNFSTLYSETYSDAMVHHSAAVFTRARGTVTAPTYPKAGDALGSINFRDAINGINTDLFFGGSSIYGFADEDFSSSNKGTSLIFKTTNLGANIEKEKMRITANGNVGINTITPTEKLDVNGNIKTSSLAGTGNRTVVADANGVLRVGSDANNNTGWSLTGNTGTNPTSHYLGTTDNQPLNFKTNSTADNNPKMTITSDGYVGIGTSTPTAKLNVVSTTNVGASIEINSASTSLPNNDNLNLINVNQTVGNYSGLWFGDKAYASGTAGALIGAKWYDHNDATKSVGFDFYTQNNGSGSIKMSIMPNGDMGVGTTAPKGKLHIDGAADNPATGTPTAAQQSNDVVVSSDGAIGVGKTSPDARVSIYNTNPALGAFYVVVDNSNGGQMDDAIFASYAGSGSPQITDFKTASKGTYLNPLPLANGDIIYDLAGSARTSTGFVTLNKLSYKYEGDGTSALSSTSFVNSGSTAMTIDKNNNVGIGATAPLSKLDIAGGVKADIHLSYRRNQSVNDYPFFINLSSYGGTFIAPEYVRKDDFIGAFLSRDAKSNLNSGGPNSYGGSEIHMKATENFTDFAKGSNILFTTTSNGTTFSMERMRIEHNGNVGIGTASPSEKLEVLGNVKANNVAITSDQRFKENITPINYGVSTINQLKPVQYIWNAKGKEKGGDNKEHIGFIAQEIEKIVPSIVNTATDSYKTVNYIELIPILTKAIQEQQKEIEELQSYKKENESLKKRLEAIESLLNK